jgi:G patch domain-containing protein 1
LLFSGFSYELTEVDIEPSKTSGDSKFKLEDRKRGVFLSFKIASNSEYKLERLHFLVIHVGLAWFFLLA